jgi:hypothetical protein
VSPLLTADRENGKILACDSGQVPASVRRTEPGGRSVRGGHSYRASAFTAGHRATAADTCRGQRQRHIKGVEMKSTVKKPMKLQLDKQTIRTLATAELEAIVGGQFSANIQSCGDPRPAPSFCF